MKTKNAAGDAPRLYQAVLAHIQHGLWNDVRNAHTLAWMVTGLVLSGRSSIPAWLPYIHSRATFAQSSERRARRWLDSPAIDPTSIYGPLVTRALRDWGSQTL
ncbi:transposase, partial [Deinococcus sp. ZS9-10]|nr:transposase [Deinococcus sp. ZS9-10]